MKSSRYFLMSGKSEKYCNSNHTHRVQATGYRLQGTGYRVQGTEYRLQGTGCRVQGTGYRVQGRCSRVYYGIKYCSRHLQIPLRKIVITTFAGIILI